MLRQVIPRSPPPSSWDSPRWHRSSCPLFLGLQQVPWHLVSQQQHLARSQLGCAVSSHAAGKAARSAHAAQRGWAADPAPAGPGSSARPAMSGLWGPSSALGPPCLSFPHRKGGNTPQQHPAVSSQGRQGAVAGSPAPGQGDNEFGLEVASSPGPGIHTGFGGKPGPQSEVSRTPASPGACTRVRRLGFPWSLATRKGPHVKCRKAGHRRAHRPASV